MRTQKELIDFYKNRLFKVKEHHDYKKTNGAIAKERCREYVKFAKKELKAVEAGRNW